jgi:hypothetical protein
MKKPIIFAACVLMAIGVIAFGSLQVAAKGGPNGPQGGQNGTTLAAYKTLDICVVDPTEENPAGTTWRYSGEIAVWNEGAIDTVGFTIEDFIEYKSSGPVWTKGPDVFIDYMPGEIPAGTTMETATVFQYSVDGAPLEGDIRNNASLTIQNHSGHLNTPWGPNPKATYDGPMPPPLCAQGPYGCTYTQGYWENHPESWPDGFDPTDTFFLATKNGACTANCGGNPNDDVYEQLPATWMDVLEAPVNLSQGYYQLAHQYIAAVLNEANGASVPQGVQDTLDLAESWLEANGPSACPTGDSCGTQKDWAAVLDSYNNGLYPDGPPHCGDE